MGNYIIKCEVCYTKIGYAYQGSEWDLVNVKFICECCLKKNPKKIFRYLPIKVGDGEYKSVGEKQNDNN
jgi:hypothetical protein